jgi:hypothetical protein
MAEQPLGGNGMRQFNWIALALGCVLWLAEQPAMANGLVLGDSLGEGVAQASGLKGLARISVHIRGPRALEQISQTPAGSTAFLVLGTNDAEGAIANLDKHIDNIVQAAVRKSIKLVWIGPPCVRKSWDSRARELVSMRDEHMCSGSLHEPDGVHLKMKGYAYMWEKARDAAGFPATAPLKKDQKDENLVTGASGEHKTARKHPRKHDTHAMRPAPVMMPAAGQAVARVQAN